MLTPYLARREPGEYLFVRPDGRRHDARSLWRAIRDACTAAGVPALSPNMIRHSRASDLDGRGTLEDAQGVLGHTSPDTTRIYARTSQELKAMQQAAATMRRVG